MKSFAALLAAALIGFLSPLIAAEISAEQPEYKAMSAEQLAHKTARVAAVQITGPWMWRVPITPDRDPADPLIPYIERASKDGADLVVFPELYLGMFRVPSPQTEKIAAAAKANNINVIVGCFEIFDDEGHYGNSTLIFDRKGEIVGRYYKAYQAIGATSRGWPPIADDPEWMMTPGQEFPVFDLDFGRIGILTCYDGYFPEPFRILSLKGAELIVWPNARTGSLEEYLALANAHHNVTHMVATNKALGSGTMIVAWPPKIVERVDKSEEAYIIADLDMEHLRTARIHGREFIQLRPEIHAEIAQPWQVWRHYGAVPDSLEPPAPDDETRRKILTGLGEPFVVPAAKPE